MNKLPMTDTVSATRWRLIVTPPLTGAENMAIDEALLRSFTGPASLPVLRLYGWQPHTLSLGRFQQAAEVLDLGRCRDASVPVVRRITGGGVIYHGDEVTYSLVCAPEQIAPVSSVKDSFRVLTGFLLSFYRSLGLDAAYAVDASPEGTRLGERTPFCFAGKESFDILVNGRKIGGNAQRRLKGTIFQHGSIPLLNRAAAGLAYMRDRSPDYAAGVVSLVECGVSDTKEELMARLESEFAGHFAVELLHDRLSDEEQRICGELLADRYGTDLWNLKGVDG